MNPRGAAGSLAAGRAALGLAILIAPRRASSRWLGEDAAHPTVRYVARSLGVRDLVLGILALCTLDDAGVASRVQAACATADSIDVLATIAARSRLPTMGAAGTIAIAGASAAAGFHLSRRIAAD